MFYVKQKALFPTPWPKIMSGEILAKETSEERPGFALPRCAPQGGGDEGLDDGLIGVLMDGIE